MKCQIAKSFVVLACGLLVGPAYADDPDASHASELQTRYHVVVQRSLGGTSSVGTSINNLGWVAADRTCLAIKAATRRCGAAAR